jgi:hypothetical protein
VSLSLPFLTPSSQRAVAQAPDWHTLLGQSAATVHSGPVAHALQPPPQSMPVSSPFFTKSEQVGVMQTCWVHTPLRQSRPSMQAARSAHAGQPVPPQSTLVSSWFSTSSLQLATPQTDR